MNVTVTPDNDPPVADDDSLTVNEGAAATTLNVLGNDSDPDSTLTAASIISFTQGANGSVVYNNDGTFTYTHNDSETASDSFTYTITDGEFQDTATVNVTVTPVNDPPVDDDELHSFTEDVGPFTAGGDALANASDVDGDQLTISAGTGPAIAGTYGTLNLAADGTYTYTLNNSGAAVQGLNAGDVVHDVFNYTVSDGQSGENASKIDITITGSDEPPVIYQDGAKWQVQDKVIQPKFGNILFNPGGEIHFDLYVKEGNVSARANLSFASNSKFFDVGLTANIQEIVIDGDESIFRVTLVNATDVQKTVSQNDQLTLVWDGIKENVDHIYLINSDEYVLLNNDGHSVKLATAEDLFLDTNASLNDDRLWLSENESGGELVNGSPQTGEAGESVDGGNGIDVIYGNSGINSASVKNDTLSGGDGNDVIDGRAGTDTIDGGLGDDTLFGGLGNDLLIGGAGNDVLAGGYGADTFDLTGGGKDTLLYHSVSASEGQDVAIGFHVGNVTTDTNADVLNIHDVLAGTVASGATTEGALAGYVILDTDSSPGNTIVKVDANGGNDGYQVLVTLNNVTGQTLQQLLDNQQIIT